MSRDEIEPTSPQWDEHKLAPTPPAPAPAGWARQVLPALALCLVQSAFYLFCWLFDPFGWQASDWVCQVFLTGAAVTPFLAPMMAYVTVRNLLRAARRPTPFHGWLYGLAALAILNLLVLAVVSIHLWRLG